MPPHSKENNQVFFTRHSNPGQLQADGGPAHHSPCVQLLLTVCGWMFTILKGTKI